MPTSTRLKEFRLKKGLTQKELGALCGIADSNIRKYENGKQNPKIETLEKIAKALNVSVSELIGYSSEEEQEEPTTIAAHFDGDEFTPEEIEQIKLFAEFVKSRRPERMELLAAHTKTPDQQHGADQKDGGAAPEDTTPAPTTAPALHQEEPEVLAAAHVCTEREPTPEEQRHADAIMKDNSEWE